MKLQLTKDKAIELSLPNFGGGKAKGLADVTGVDLTAGDPRGCPAVRLARKKNAIQLLAVGFVPPPDGSLPTKWEETPKQPTWSMPPEFQAPHCAIAVSSSDMFIRQTTEDAIMADLPGVKPAGGAAPHRKLMLKGAKPDVPAPSPESGAPVKIGVPVSREGVRFTAVRMGEDSFLLESGLPEYQVLWVSRLLPEGKRPTASSIQTTPSAALNAILDQSDFIAEDRTAMLVIVERSAVYFAGFREGRLVLFRQCPGAAGYEAIREAVKSRLGLDDTLVDSVMDDTLIDPRPAMEPLVRPILQELEISLDYLVRRHSMNMAKIFVFGLPAGLRYWEKIVGETLHIPLVAPGVFDGVTLSRKTKDMPYTPAQSQVFLAAFGAARAAMEGQP